MGIPKLWAFDIMGTKAPITASALIELPAKPANWKQETYDAKLPELLEAQREKLDTDLILGLVGGFDLIDVLGEAHEHHQVVFGQDGKGCPNYLLLGQRVQPGDVVVSFDTRRKLRRTAWTFLRAGFTPQRWMWSSAIDNRVKLLDLDSVMGFNDSMLHSSNVCRWLNLSTTMSRVEVIAQLARELDIDPGTVVNRAGFES